MRNTVKIALLTLGTFILAIAGCKTKCYECYDFNGVGRAIRGTDTIFVSSYYSSTFQDSINHYINMGFHIDSIFDDIIFRDHATYTRTPCDFDFTTPPQFDSCIVVKE